jgi:beta-glucanase (GH16 family)
MVWSDEFDGDSLDMSKWSYMLGDGTNYGLPSGWGNNELQFYREQNAVVADGMLTITAKKQFFGGKQYTSARIRTKEKGEWTYGRVEARAKLPVGQGLWTAIWMLPTDETYGGWAASGEIDIMEHLGHEPSRVYGTLHFGGQWPQNQHKGASFDLDTGSFHNSFHLFALEWEEGEIRWYVDGELYQTQGEGDWYSTAAGFPAPFNQDFHLLVNLAVGGNWPGSPDGTTEFPQELVLDYVRVYEKAPVNAESGLPGMVFGLKPNVPNPFSETTTLHYTIPEASRVSLELFDVTGKSVAMLVESEQQPGDYRVNLDAGPLSPGLYTCRLVAGNITDSRRLILISD